MSFQTSGAVPIAADDSPQMPSSAGTVAASGKGQAKTVCLPTRAFASSLPNPTSDLLDHSVSDRKKDIFPKINPDSAFNNPKSKVGGVQVYISAST